MALVGMRPDAIEYPAEPGVRFSIRALSGSELRKADAADSRKKLELAQAAGSALEALNDIDEKTRERARASAQARTNGSTSGPDREPTAADYAGYDVDTVINIGLDGWEGPGYDVPCTDANKRKLDAKTEEWLFVEIMKRSKLREGEGTSSSGESMRAFATAAAESPES